jgi:hypothetical protein
VSVPGYWMHEQSGRLAPVVTKYLEGKTLTGDEISIMRSYLRQWVYASGFDGGPAQVRLEIASLRARADRINSNVALRDWLRDALELGIDPL